MEIGRTIRQQREYIGVSQAELASASGLSQGYLSQIENGDVANPSAAVLFRLAKELCLDPRSLLPGNGSHPNSGAAADAWLEVRVAPDLLSYLSRLSHQQQRLLLSFLEQLHDFETPASTES